MSQEVRFLVSRKLNVLIMQKVNVLMSQKVSFIMLQKLSFIMSHKRSILTSRKVEFIILQKLNKQFVINSEFYNTQPVIQPSETTIQDNCLKNNKLSGFNVELGACYSVRGNI